MFQTGPTASRSTGVGWLQVSAFASSSAKERRPPPGMTRDGAHAVASTPAVMNRNCLRVQHPSLIDLSRRITQR